MQWINLIGDEDFSLDVIKRIEHYGSVLSYEVEGLDGRYCVDFGEAHIFYDIEQDCDDFEEDLKAVPFNNPSFLTVSYTSKECMRNVLTQDNFPKKIYIDNDFGLIVSLEEFITMGMPLDKEDMRNINKI